MPLYSLYIINKAGGLIYQTDFAQPATNALSTTPGSTTTTTTTTTTTAATSSTAPPASSTGGPPPRLSSNDYLVLAGTFHGVHAITAKLSPTGARAPNARPPSGLEVLESEHFRLQCFQTLTGIKFMLLADPQNAQMDQALMRIYDLHADYAMKNAFYNAEMPIRSELFDQQLLKVIKAFQ